MKKSHLLLCVGLILFIGAGLAATAWLWREQERRTAKAQLPPLPDLERWPPEFRQQILQVTAAAADGSREQLGRLAQLYFVNGFSNEAQLILPRLRELDPTNPRWPYLQAELHLRTSQPAAARPELEAVVKLDPRYAPAWLKLAKLLTNLEDYAAAEQCFTKAVELSPGDVEAEFDYLTFQAWHGKQGDPRRSLIALVAAHPGLKELHRFLAEIHTAAGDTAAAEKQRRLAAAANNHVPNRDPWIEELHVLGFDPYRLAIVVTRLVQEKRLPEAEILLKRAITFAPSDAILRRSLGEIYELQHRPAEALTVAQQAVQACPDDPRLPEYLAQLLCLQHRPEDAIATLRPALQRWPQEAALQAGLGFALREAGQIESAVTTLRTAVQLNPNLVEARYWLGFCQLVLGQRDDGVATVEKILAIRPDYPEALTLLGTLAIEAGDVAAAERHVTRLHALQPDEGDAQLLFAALHLLKGRIAIDAGDLAGADELFRTGLSVAPDFAPLLHARGMLALQRERWADAVDALGQYVRLQPDEPDTYALLGSALMRAGRNAEARQAYEKGLALAQRAGDQPRVQQFKQLLGM